MSMHDADTLRVRRRYRVRVVEGKDDFISSQTE